ncbi:hypothetical protein D3C87_1267360 [compost metagenome]
MKLASRPCLPTGNPATSTKEAGGFASRRRRRFAFYEAPCPTFDDRPETATIDTLIFDIRERAQTRLTASSETRT